MPFQWWEHFVLNIYLHGAPLLPLTQGLDALKTVGGQLYLKGNGEMMGLGGGLGALESVGSAVLTNNGNTQVSGRMRYLTRVYLRRGGHAEEHPALRSLTDQQSGGLGKCGAWVRATPSPVEIIVTGMCSSLHTFSHISTPVHSWPFLPVSQSVQSATSRPLRPPLGATGAATRVPSWWCMASMAPPP